MNLDKAIEILKAKAIRASQAEDFECGDALVLGIEALKALDDCRKGDFTYCEELLLGETKE